MIDTELRRRDEVEPICKVPLITNPKEEQTLVATTSKVCKTF